MKATHQFKMRLPEGLRDEIAKAAERNQRSMSGEIVRRLEGSFTQDNTASILYAIRMLPTQIKKALKELPKP